MFHNVLMMSDVLFLQKWKRNVSIVLSISLAINILRLGTYAWILSIVSGENVFDHHLISVIPFKLKKRDIYFLMNVLVMFCLILHGLGNISLLHGICTSELRKINIEEWYEKCKERFKNGPKKLNLVIILLVLSIVPTIVGLAGDIIHVIQHDPNKWKQHWGALSVYFVFTLLAHCFSFAIRLSMILITAELYHNWDYNKLQQPQQQDPRKYFNEKLKALVTGYAKRGNDAKILRIYKSWFIFEWAIYFIVIAAVLANVVQPRLKKDYTNHDTYHVILFLYYMINGVYYIAMFVTPYGCGIIANSRHKRYVKKVRKELLKSFNGEFTTCIPFELQKDFDFVPQVLGISIPLDSPGYNLTIVLSIFAFTCTFFTF